MLDSVVQLITVLLIFILVLVLTYYVTKLTAKLQQGKYKNANVEILETSKIAQTKYIQLVRIGKKYFSYVVCKENVTLLGELAEDDLAESVKESDNTAAKSFKDIFDRLKK